MNNELLPIGSVIELNDGKKFIIISYEEDEMYNLSYFCGAYPSYSLLDLIPNGNIKEFRNKYDCNGNDMYLKFNANFKVVFEGYKNDKFYELQKKYNNFKHK